MNSIERIKTQIELIKKQTDDLIEKIEISKWNITPDIIETNMNWQIGHIILANYLHGIASITGANEKIREKLNVKDFIKFYGLKSNPSEHLNEKPKNEELKEIYNFIFKLIWLELEKVKESDFNKETEIPNPAAKTKYEALTLLFKHQSWHNGQIAILNRVLNK
jgi:hypothetical protein